MKKFLKSSKKLKLLVLAACLVICGTVGATFALLSQKTTAASNEFAGAAVNIAVIENGVRYEEQKSTNDTYVRLTSGVSQEKHVAIENYQKSDYPTTDTYVRVRLVPSFVYDEGTLYAGQVAAIDMRKVVYTFGEDKQKLWKFQTVDDENYYYYTKALKPGESTANLIDAVTYEGEIPENVHFELRVIAEGVASKQKGSLKAWNIDSFEDLSYLSE